MQQETLNMRPTAAGQKFDDGIPERSPFDDKTLPRPKASENDDNEAEKSASVKFTEALKGNAAEKPDEGSTGKLLMCDRYPGEQLTARAWASVTGVKPAQIYNSAYRNFRAQGFKFTFVEGHAPAGKPKHEPKKGKRAKAATMPVVPPVASDVLRMPASAPALNGAQVASIVTALGSAANAASITKAIDWAHAAISAHARLMGVLAGTMLVKVSPDGVVRTATRI